MYKLALITVFLFFKHADFRTIEITADVPSQQRTVATNDDFLNEDREYWMRIGADTLTQNLALEKQEKLKVAKNVIVFIGDGMGISTITASRIYKGQKYHGAFGEEHKLTFENFPNVALVKTYNIDRQTPDSAATATAMFSGVKTRYEAVGVDVTSSTSQFNSSTYNSSKLATIMDWAQATGKHTGIVTTATLTDATPAATYANIYHRDVECDGMVKEEDKPFLKDIARQLVEDEPGRSFKVALGGGQNHFGYTLGPNGEKCLRTDGLNLTQTWIDSRNGTNYVFAATTGDLSKVDDDTDYLFGVFAPRHLPYELQRDETAQGSPSLTEMTRQALKVLKKSTTGFVLMVEGAKIDKAHHLNYAKLALEETVEFDNAIQLALDETRDDTLILVTADHSHAFTINGYGVRGADILGSTVNEWNNNKRYSILSYANGEGFYYHYQPNATNSSNTPWKELSDDDEEREQNPEYQHPAMWSLDSETHGGEDVAVFAKGPNSHLLRGVFEQNYIAHVISYAACIGPHKDINSDCKNSVGRINGYSLFAVICVCMFVMWY